ncbi:uncharacterized protein LOC113870322 [Abrus precatorius]|uniref:Uncharacterized protein LOC113870322 n=1 Tax=Abrus precatorius TaxID=3816 RepID=A0A8B8M4R7_ABRPR|nr:uncharacterized protein LOC113870322 [Abrus precatorius]
MGSKGFLVLVMLLASLLVLYAEVAPKDVDNKFDRKDDDIDISGVDAMKYGYRGWHGWGWGRGWGYCYYGCCDWNYYGRCIRCCYYRGEHVDAQTHDQPQN